MFSAKGLVITQQMKDEFMEIHDRIGPQPSVLTGFPHDTQVRCQLTDTVQEYLGDDFERLGFNILDGKHGAYGPHVDSIKGWPDVYCRLNVLVCGHPGRIQYYTDECRPNLTPYPDEYFQQSEWYFNNNRAEMWDFADRELVPDRVYNVEYPAFIRTDQIHAVINDPKHRGERRVVFSVPFTSKTYDQMKEKYDV